MARNLANLFGNLLTSIQSLIVNFARVIKQIAENGGAVAEETTKAPAAELK